MSDFLVTWATDSRICPTAPEALALIRERAEAGQAAQPWEQRPVRVVKNITVELEPAQNGALVKESPQSEPEAHTPRVSETPAAGEVLRCRGCGFTANQKKPVERIEALTRHTEEKHPEVAAQWKARAP